MNLKDLHNFEEFYLDGVYMVLQSLTVPPLIYFHYVKRLAKIFLKTKTSAFHGRQSVIFVLNNEEYWIFFFYPDILQTYY